MAAGDLTTLANVKQWANIQGASDDALLARLITSVSQFIQSWLGRQLALTAYAQAFDGNNGTRLVLPNYPVVAVSSVKIDGMAIPLSTGPSLPGYVADAYGVLLRGFVLARGASNVEVAYTAGYADLPVEIEQACIELVALRYAERLRPGVASRNLGGESVNYTDKGMTDGVVDLLRQYRKVAPA